jgi:hypothetical protein
VVKLQSQSIQEGTMAKPRIFISSTFYDLRHVREDLERFISTLGYDAIRHETGRVTYRKDEKLESSAYRELELCDILVCMVGGRFGAASTENPGFSITQTEIQHAITRGIPVYIFLERGVAAEYKTYLLNKESKETKYSFADDVRIYAFVEYLYGLPLNNPIFQFENIGEITAMLREQWAGLFQRFLQAEGRLGERNTLDQLNASAATLKELVTFLTAERKGSIALDAIVQQTHPLFARLQNLLNVGYRVFFLNRQEMVAWLAVRQWKPVDESARDDDSKEEFYKDGDYLKFSRQMFDRKGSLIPFSSSEWDDQWVQKKPIPPDSDDSDDPDISSDSSDA